MRSGNIVYFMDDRGNLLISFQDSSWSMMTEIIPMCIVDIEVRIRRK